MSDYVPSGFEKGHAPFDIGQILTRHASRLKGDQETCDRVQVLHDTIGIDAMERLSQALATSCSCPAGDSDAEMTTVIRGQLTLEDAQTTREKG